MWGERIGWEFNARSQWKGGGERKGGGGEGRERGDCRRDAKSGLAFVGRVLSVDLAALGTNVKELASSALTASLRSVEGIADS